MIVVSMPQPGSVLKWHRVQGDPVRAGDLLCEIETDKTVIAVEAAADGVVGQILVEAGESNIAAGRELARIAPWVNQADSLGQGAADSAQSAAQPSGIDATGRIAISPRARRLASEARLTLASIRGSGPRGRIVERDVLRAAASRAASSSEVSRSASSASASELVELDGMRQAIAVRLSAAKQSIPHFYMSVEIELDALAALREQANADPARAHDGMPQVKLTINDFVVKAQALALMKVPEVNAIWDAGRIRRFKNADVGVAVTVTNGLYTPILRNAESKPLSTLARELRSLAARARERSLRAQDCEGGASTVSNLGMFGVERFSAIINPPQSSILAVGAAREQLVVRARQPVVATMMSVTLSCDHRVIDGALAARFVGEVKRLLEAPRDLTL